jgi:hypothetical protein
VGSGSLTISRVTNLNIAQEVGHQTQPYFQDIQGEWDGLCAEYQEKRVLKRGLIPPTPGLSLLTSVCET